MERIRQYSREISAGSFVLLWVLGAPGAVSAAPVLTPGVTAVPQDCFMGQLDICNNSHGAGTLLLEFEQTSGSGTLGCAGTFIETADVTGTGLTDFSGTAKSGCVVPGSSYAFDLEQVHFVGDCGSKSFFACGGNITAGDFTFTQAGTSGPQLVTNGTDFAISFADPFDATAGQFTSPAIGGAPELNAASMVNPLALALGTLLMLSDVRRRRRTDS